jgi:hypothetical protein
MLAVHCVAMFALRAGRGALLWFSATSATTAAVLVPFAWYASKQVDQVDWIARLGSPSPIELGYQYFDHSESAAIVAVVLMVAAVCVKPRPRLQSLVRPAGALATIAVAWMLLPTVVLLAYRLFGHRSISTSI